MSKKKSYMNKSNILKEGFLKNFFKILTLGRDTSELDKAVNILNDALIQFYDQGRTIPKELFVPFSIPDQKAVSSLFFL